MGATGMADMNDLRRAAGRIRNTLDRERRMREQVFRRDPKRLAAKVAEIDAALEELAVLEAALGLDAEPPAPMQAGLFG